MITTTKARWLLSTAIAMTGFQLSTLADDRAAENRAGEHLRQAGDSARDAARETGRAIADESRQLGQDAKNFARNLEQKLSQAGEVSTTADSKDFQKTISGLVSNVVSGSDMSGLSNYFVAEDRMRFKNLNSAAELRQQINQLKEAYKSKFNKDLAFDNEIFPSSTFVEVKVKDPQKLSDWPVSQPTSSSLTSPSSGNYGQSGSMHTGTTGGLSGTTGQTGSHIDSSRTTGQSAIGQSGTVGQSGTSGVGTSGSRSTDSGLAGNTGSGSIGSGSGTTGSGSMGTGSTGSSSTGSGIGGSTASGTTAQPGVSGQASSPMSHSTVAQGTSLKAGDTIGVMTLGDQKSSSQAVVSAVKSSDGWRLDIPDNLDAAQLQTNLSKHLQMAIGEKDQWGGATSNADQARQSIATHVLKAFYDANSSSSVLQAQER